MPSVLKVAFDNAIRTVILFVLVNYICFSSAKGQDVTIVDTTRGLRDIAISEVDGMLAYCEIDRNGINFVSYDSKASFSIEKLPGIPIRLAFSSDGKKLAAICADGLIVMQVQNKAWEYHKMPGVCSSVAFSPDCRILAHSMDGSIVLWNSVNGKHIRTVVRHDSTIGDLCFSANGELLVSCCQEGRVAITAISDCRLVKSLQIEGDQPRFVLFGLKDDSIVVGTLGKLLVWPISGEKAAPKSDELFFLTSMTATKRRTRVICSRINNSSVSGLAEVDAVSGIQKNIATTGGVMVVRALSDDRLIVGWRIGKPLGDGQPIEVTGRISLIGTKMPE